jgi:hypothetical protein
MNVRPVSVGLVLCELAIVDDRTRNVTHTSCFSQRLVEGPLTYMPPFYVVAALAGGHGRMPGRLVVQRLDTLDITYHRTFTLDFADPLRELSGIFRVRAHAIPVYGYYEALLIVDGEAIAQKKFSILPKGPQP